MKYILTTDYDVCEVKDEMVNIWKSKSKKDRDWYQYEHPEIHCGFSGIHKDHVLHEASTLKELAEKVQADSNLVVRMLEAHLDVMKKYFMTFEQATKDFIK